MPLRIEWRSYLVIFAVLCLLVAGLAGIPWKKDARSGGLGTTLAGKTTIAGYDLNAGDAIHFEYEADSPCWFTITTDWFNPEIGEKLNLSGTHYRGIFKCPEDGRYLLLVFFLEVPEGDLATVEYEFYALDDSSRAILITKPVLLTVLAVILVSMVSIACRRSRTANLDGETSSINGYWGYFASGISNWIAIAAGASLLVAASIVDLANLTSELPESIRDWLFTIGANLLILGLMIGLMISWPKYKKETL